MKMNVNKQVTNMEKDKLVLSVVVPVYNLENYICQCLQSLCMQGFGLDEYEKSRRITGTEYRNPPCTWKISVFL